MADAIPDSKPGLASWWTQQGFSESLNIFSQDLSQKYLEEHFSTEKKFFSGMPRTCCFCCDGADAAYAADAVDAVDAADAADAADASDAAVAAVAVSASAAVNFCLGFV